jgi:hypothetical protein
VVEQVDIGLLLIGPSRVVEARIVEALAASGFGDVTLAQARLLRKQPAVEAPLSCDRHRCRVRVRWG